MPDSALIDPRVMDTITRYMESLRGTVEGGELYGLISRTLRKHGRLGAIAGECLSELHAQLEAYAADPVTLPSMRIRARLLQQHIGAYLPDFERPDAPPEPRPREAPRPGPPRFEDAPILEETALAPPATAPEPCEAAGEAPLEGVIERPSEQAEQSATERTEKYQALLRSEKDAWAAIYGTVKDYHKLKQAWMKSLDELARQRDALEEKLLKTSEHLSLLEAERDKLRADLERAREAARRPRLLPTPRASRPTARNGALPRREAFVREVETEVKRIKRTGAALALGLIAIEGLERVAEEHGAEAGEAVLRCYATEILSNFRAYDRVALYDRDLYAVMFPHTRKEGAQRALEKAHKRANETHVAHEGRSFPLPPFIGVLVLYAAGEDPGAFLARADAALSRMRESGQTGIHLA